jgi:hypothetical protein
LGWIGKRRYIETVTEKATNMAQFIYLDHRQPPARPQAREAMLPWLSGLGIGFANPHSMHRATGSSRG